MLIILLLIFIIRKRLFKSIEFSEKLLEIEKKKDPEQRLSTYEILKDSYGALNDFPQQNKYLRLYSSLSDSLTNTEQYDCSVF